MKRCRLDAITIIVAPAMQREKWNRPAEQSDSIGLRKEKALSYPLRDPGLDPGSMPKPLKSKMGPRELSVERFRRFGRFGHGSRIKPGMTKRRGKRFFLRELSSTDD